MKVDTKGYCDMDEMIAFIEALPKVQQVVILSKLADKMMSHPGNSIEATNDVRKSLQVMQVNWLYNLG